MSRINLLSTRRVAFGFYKYSLDVMMWIRVDASLIRLPPAYLATTSEPTMADEEQPPIEAVVENQDQEMEEYEGEEGDYNEEDYDDELFDDAEEEAEAMVQQLGAALWADISKAYAEQGVQLSADQEVVTATNGMAPVPSEERDDEESVFLAVQAVLDFADTHTSFQRLLSEIIVPGVEENTLYDALVDIAGSKSVTSEMANTLSTLVETVASSEYFASKTT